MRNKPRSVGIESLESSKKMAAKMVEEVAKQGGSPFDVINIINVQMENTFGKEIVRIFRKSLISE